MTEPPHHWSSLIGANNYGWCFEYDGFDADDDKDHEDSGITRQSTDRWHDGFTNGVVFSTIFLLSHLGPGPRLVIVLQHLQPALN